MLPKCSLRDTSVKFAALGKNTSGAEVLNVSPHGFWPLVGAEKLFDHLTAEYSARVNHELPSSGVSARGAHAER